MAHSARPAPQAPFRAVRSAVSLVATPRPMAPPSERVVSAVLMFADLRQEHDDGRVTLGLSAGRLARDDLALLLGEERSRAADVSIVWDEAECEVVRVIDLAPLRAIRETADDINRYAAARKRSVRRGGDFTREAAAA